MQHPEAAIVPVLMVADYLLTIAGARGRQARYAAHFRTEHYELNPAFQQAVRAGRWWNPRHLAATALTAVLLIGLAEFGDPHPAFIESMLGCLIVLYGAVIGRHLTNLLTFRRLERRPAEVSGQVTMAHDFVLSLSFYQTLGVALPVLLIAVFAPSHFAAGGAGGVVALAVVHLLWRRKHARARGRRPSGPPPVPPAAGPGSTPGAT